MRSIIARLIGLRKRSNPPAAIAAHAEIRTQSPAPPCASHSPHPAARRLAEQIDLAVERGQWERAERLARDAARIMHTSPRLTERVARLRLARGRAETALAIIEASQMESASMRLLRAACLIELGRTGEAHLDLREWSRRSAAPMQARRLVALLESGAGNWIPACAGMTKGGAGITGGGAGTGAMNGDRDAAVAALLHNLRQIEDPRTLELLVISAAAEGREEQAEHWAQRLLLASRWSDRESTHTIEPALLLQTLGFDAAKIDRATPAATPSQIETLAMEMIATPGIEQALPALIRAQEHSPDVRAAELMYEAGQRALDSLANQASACESLARLALLLEKREEAVRWAKRGAEINPMSASLARLVYELTNGPDDTAAPEADVLKPQRRKAA